MRILYSTSVLYGKHYENHYMLSAADNIAQLLLKYY